LAMDALLLNPRLMTIVDAHRAGTVEEGLRT